MLLTRDNQSVRIVQTRGRACDKGAGGMATFNTCISGGFCALLVLALSGCSTSYNPEDRQSNEAKSLVLSNTNHSEISARLSAIRSRFTIKPVVSPALRDDLPDSSVPKENTEPMSVLGKSVATGFESREHLVIPVFEGFKKWNGLRTATVKLPAKATGAVELEDDTSKVRVSFALRGAQESQIETVDGYAVYSRGFRGSDIVHRVHPEGTEDYVVFETKPEVEQLVYDVDVSHVAGLRLVSNTLEFMDEGGAPRLRIAPPYVVDSNGERQEAKIEVSGCDSCLTV